MVLDTDLASIQESRHLVKKAKEAQLQLAHFNEQQIDKILVSIVEAIEANAERLARMACKETEYGIVEHKIAKNLFASREVYESTKHIKTIGTISEDSYAKVIRYAAPMGVLVGVTPRTNPTSTIIHNALCAIKGANSIVFSPHPFAVQCGCATAELINEAAVRAGAPDGVCSCLSLTSLQATNELMHHSDVAAIIATGGPGLVKSAYSAGKPAFGVGSGNVPVFIERTADVKQAVSDIMVSKTFDNGMICASEQSIIVDQPIQDEVIAELKRLGAYFLSPEEVKKAGRVVITPAGGMNNALVGQLPAVIAEKAGISIPPDAKLLIAPMDGYGRDYPLSHEKLTTVLGFYVVNDWKEACNLSIELLKLGGIGHSCAIHSLNETIIHEFLQKPVFRIIVNTPSALGGIGQTTGLMPSLTLGCGTWGGSSISENLGPQHLINIKHLTYGIKKATFAKTQTFTTAASSLLQQPKVDSLNIQSDAIEDIVKQVLQQLKVC